MIKSFQVSELDQKYLEQSNSDVEMCTTDFTDIKVNKPWGYEYLLFENADCAVWILSIDYQQNTSMHCHIYKDTSLICLQGLVSSNTLSVNNLLAPLDGVFLPQKVFHQTNVLSEQGAVLLEVESPVNKFDLVRINDQYGRRGKDYEDTRFFEKHPSLTWQEGFSERAFGDVRVVLESLEITKFSEADHAIWIPLEGEYRGQILHDPCALTLSTGRLKCLKIYKE